MLGATVLLLAFSMGVPPQIQVVQTPRPPTDLRPSFVRPGACFSVGTPETGAHLMTYYIVSHKEADWYEVRYLSKGGDAPERALTSLLNVAALRMVTLDPGGASCDRIDGRAR